MFPISNGRKRDSFRWKLIIQGGNENKRNERKRGEGSLELAAKSQEGTIAECGGYSKWEWWRTDSRRFFLGDAKKSRAKRGGHRGHPAKERTREERERVFLAVTHCCWLFLGDIEPWALASESSLQSSAAVASARTRVPLSQKTSLAGSRNVAAHESIRTISVEEAPRTFKIWSNHVNFGQNCASSTDEITLLKIFIYKLLLHVSETFRYSWSDISLNTKLTNDLVLTLELPQLKHRISIRYVKMKKKKEKTLWYNKVYKLLFRLKQKSFIPLRTHSFILHS